MTKKRNWLDLSILTSNVLEHFDTSLYAFLAPILAQVFFPAYEVVMGLILTYSILTTSVVTRPLGAFIFGMLAIKKSPIQALSYSLIGVAICTVSIGFIPAYSDIGWYAPALVILMRGIKGVCASGEVTISQLYILEDKNKQNLYKTSSYYQISTILGMVLASGATTFILSYEIKTQFWLWRVFFVLGGITAIFACILRYQGMQYQIDVIGKRSVDISLIKNFWSNKLKCFAVALNTGIGHITYSIPFVLMNVVIPLVNSEVSIAEMMSYNTFLLIFDGFLLLGCSRISSKISPDIIIKMSCYCLTIGTPFLFILMRYYTNILVVSLTRVFIIICGVLIASIQCIYYTQLFKNDNKYLIIGISSAFGASMIGKTTPAICLYLFHATNSIVSIGWYISIFALFNAFIASKTSKMKV